MNWPTIKLERVTSKVGSGATPRGGEAVYQPTGVPLIRSMNIHLDGFRPDGLVHISDAEASLLDHVTVQEDDVLFNITGASIGRVTTAPKEMAGARVNQHVCILRPMASLHPRFLAYYLGTAEQQALINSTQVGGTRQAVTKAMLLNWKIPLPAISEQRRIVDTLAQADTLRQKRAKADALAGRILPALFYSLFGDPATNPRNFPRVRLDKVIADTRNGLYKHADFYGRGTKILKMFNILNGRLNLTRVDTVEITPAELAAYELLPGDILINRVNTPELVGKCAVITDALGTAVFESKNIRMRLNSEQAEPDYIAHFLNTPFGHATLCQGVKHAIGMATINNSDVRGCQIPLPPLAEQRKWASLVRSCHHLVDQGTASHNHIENLFQSLLYRAFTGDLTAKWRQTHMKELLAEMEHQARVLNLPSPERN